MAVVVVGGQARKVGKTSLMAALIAAMPEKRWTAMKITQHQHGGERPVSVLEESDRQNGTDSGRYLAAGAVRSLWIRASPLEAAMPQIRKEMEQAGNVMIESNSILGFLQPDLFLCVLDGRELDFKDSANRYLDRADAVVVMGGALHLESTGSALQFRASLDQCCPAKLLDFIRLRLG